MQQTADELELSVVIPCLNEADTLEQCVRRARETLAAHGIAGEVVVADNGSSDDSVEIARTAGARVVEVLERGYGAALMGGIGAARGRYVLMGDADGSYDFGEAPRFLAELRRGAQLVQGCRLRAGGGHVLPGAMPALHRLLGNPLFSWLARQAFRVPVQDVYCGLRAFDRASQQALDQRCTGMEFAVEMVAKAARRGQLIAQVAITLHPDGRRAHAPHLRTFRDGWRTLRFLVLVSPGRLLLVPGLVLIAGGLAGYALALPGVRVLGARIDAHTLVVASVLILCGSQAALLAVVVRAWAASSLIWPPNAALERLRRAVGLGRGLLLGALVLVAGGALVAVAFERWRRADFGSLDYASTMRWVVPGATLIALGVQAVLTALLVSLVGIDRR